MGSRRRNVLILLMVVGMLFASVVIVLSSPTRLGLDLKGGVELVYQGQPTPQAPEVTPDAIDRSIEIIRERTDKLGVAEPEIQRLGSDQISVGLPDVKNAERAIRQVGSTAQLFFYDWEPNVIGEPEQPHPRLFDAVKEASRRERECEDCTTSGPRHYMFDKSTKKALAGPEGKREDLFIDFDGKRPPDSEIIEVPQGTLVVENEQQQQEHGNRQREAPTSYFIVRDRPELGGSDIKNPEQNFDPTTNQPNVTMDFSGEGRRKFHEVTRRIAERGLENHLPGNPVIQDSHHFAIVLDNGIVSRPYIDFQENPDGIDGRTGAQISGAFDINEAQDLANFLRIGALPIELKLISQTQVSATLGQQALDQGLKAGIAGLIVVVLFLLSFYRLLGLVAGLALLTYAGFFYALIELIPITLTLPGIAGLILTIGVAADSNIVIFERIKEEVRSGKAMFAAISTGYSKGIRTIIDANVVTLMTAFILFVLATAGVKGFAFTLGVGTIVSLFTAVVFTQALLGTFGRSRALSRPSILGSAKERIGWRFDFHGASRWFFSMSGMILVAGAVALATLGMNLGIDFESGTRVKTAVEKASEVDDVRKVLAPLGLDDAEIQAVEDKDFGPNVFQIQTAQLEPEDISKIENALDESLAVAEDGFQSESVGPTFGATVARSAALAIVFSLLLICGYVALRFEPKFAVPVMIAVFHDILITAGIYSITEREMTSATVAALLTILGYSLYDTIIVFDRIRENIPRMPRATFGQIYNRAMSEVLTRSLATTFSTLLPVIALFVFGGETLKDFAFALIVGLLSGTYSSIFIAGPVLVAWKSREPSYQRREEYLVELMGRVPAYADENEVARVEGERAAERRAVGPVRAPAGEDVLAAEPERAAASTAVAVEERRAAEPGEEPSGDGVAPEPEAADSALPADSREAERAARKARREQRRSRKKHGRHR